MPNWAKINLLHRGVRAGLSAVSAPFAPSDITGLDLWLDATVSDSIHTEVGGEVEKWDDQSGNGNNLLQATAAQFPAQATLNGLNVIHFKDGNDRLELIRAAVTGCEGPNLTVICVFNDDMLNTNAYNSPIVYQSTTWLTGWSIGAPTAAGASMEASIEAWNTNPALITNVATPADSLDIIAFTYDGSNIKTYKNDAESIVTTQPETAVPSFAANSYLVAGAADESGTYGLTGHVGEILVYDSAVSDEDLASLFAYLAAKWQA